LRTSACSTISTGVPSASTRPSLMMYARSQMPSVSRTLWSVMSTPMPRALRKLMMRWISITAIGSTPANGSSSRMKRGCVASARAISTRRRSPPKAPGGRVAQLLDRQLAQKAAQQLLDQLLLEGLALRVELQLEHGADVLLDGQLAEDRGFLRQVRQAQAGAPVDRHPLDALALDRDLAGVGAHQSDDHVEAGRLAGAVGPSRPPPRRRRRPGARP
jgi:hypothetical protein